MKTIADRIEAIAKATKGGGEISQLRSELKENLQRANQLSLQSLTFFVVLTSVWFLLKLSITSKISTLGLEIANIPLLLVVLPVLAAFAFYRFACAEGVVALINDALQLIYKHELPESYREDMTELLTVMAVQHIESSLENMEHRHSIFRNLSSLWVSMLGVFLLFAPVGILIWMFVSGISIDHVSPLVIRDISLTVTGLLTVRSVTIIIRCMQAL